MNRLPRSYRSGCQSPIQSMFILIALSGGDHLKCASSKRVNPYSPKRYSPCPLGILLFAFAALTVSSIRSRHPNRTEPSQAGFVGGEQRRPQSSLYDSFSLAPHPFPTRMMRPSPPTTFLSRVKLNNQTGSPLLLCLASTPMFSHCNYYVGGSVCLIYLHLCSYVHSSQLYYAP